MQWMEVQRERASLCSQLHTSPSSVSMMRIFSNYHDVHAGVMTHEGHSGSLMGSVWLYGCSGSFHGIG